MTMRGNLSRDSRTLLGGGDGGLGGLAHLRRHANGGGVGRRQRRLLGAPGGLDQSLAARVHREHFEQRPALA